MIGADRPVLTMALQTVSLKQENGKRPAEAAIRRAIIYLTDDPPSVPASFDRPA